MMAPEEHNFQATFGCCSSWFHTENGERWTMRKTALVLAHDATLGLAGVAAPAPAEARRGFGPGLAGGLIAGALIGGLASNAYRYGPGHGYGHAPGYHDAQ